MPLWKLILNIFVILVVIGCAVKVWTTDTTGSWIIIRRYGWNSLIGSFVGLFLYFFGWARYGAKRDGFLQEYYIPVHL